MGRIQAYSVVVQTQVHFFDNAWIYKAKTSVEFKLGHGADEVCKKGWSGDVRHLRSAGRDITTAMQGNRPGTSRRKGALLGGLASLVIVTLII